ncbi:MAG: NAD(P)/FAD-dependent oxidoreductase [Bacteroidota bacterium]
MSKSFVSYNRFNIEASYDAIIIGSGMGGLSAGAFLSKEGKKVLILEQHYTAGGYTQIFKRKDYEWDIGIHYIGDVERPNSQIRQMFDYVTNGNLKWADMGQVYDKIIFGDEVYEFHKGKENFKKQLKTYFNTPEDHKAIDKYLDLVKSAQRTSRMFFAEKALPPAVSWIFAGNMRKRMLEFSRKTTREVLQSLTSNEKLIGVLTGQYGDYGLPPGKSSFIMHSILVNHYMNGGFFPVGGSAAILQNVAPVIKEAGGDILVCAEVKEIIVEGNKAVGVMMEDGKKILAPLVISSAGVINTYAKLLPEKIQAKHKFTDKLDKVTPSVSYICLYIGFKEDATALGLEKPNLWVYPENSYNHDENVERYINDPSAEFPVVYFSFPSAKDPDWPNRYPGKSTIDIITLAPYDWYTEWEDTRWKKRGEAYDAKKEDLSQRLLQVMYKYLPQLKGKVDYYELSTPLSTKHFMHYEKGELYGLDHVPERFNQRFLRAHTPVKNLFLTGQDIVSAGVGGALASGMLTASAILKRDLSAKIRKAATKVPADQDA